ncbi:MAG: glycosyl hydrolase-related protein [Gemmatimonadetes bacterium]|nr:glycosyl hydrolase-related protein [Gemmatimonadota bacterium]
MASHPTRPTVHLLCNSHLDPVWLWEWPEGAGEALSLARTVCDLLEEHETFVFNRNEVQFYAWIEEYDPALFQRIRRLVAEGRWHVMGGWYLQPDCNLPSGESFVRQILVGRRYFRDRFGVTPTVAANVDSFGHSRGLVQILARSGYDAYLFCRPKREQGSVPAAEFTWAGFDGSEVTAALAESHYNSAPGGTAEKIREWMERDADKVVRQVPWGVGDHGGGPSRRDLKDIAALAAGTADADIVHSTPEAYFADLRVRGGDLPRHPGDLNPWAVGCYTSAMRLKARHRRLENALFRAEKMATTAWAQGRMEYPADELAGATRALLANEFHDILGGTSIPSGEETALDELGHGLTLTRRVTTRAFFALADGQKRGKEGVHTILVYNPHPFAVRGVVECEVQPAWPHRPRDFGIPTVTSGRTLVPAQAEKEESNIDEDHRKRVAFLATVRPGRMNRFECRFEKVRKRPAARARFRNGRLRLRTEDLEVVVSADTGLIDRYRVGGTDFLEAGAVGFRLMRDDADPWGSRVKSFRRPAGQARLMSPEKAARFAGVGTATLAPVRVVEDGPVRVVVEALFSCGDSAICQRYKLPREGTEVEVEARVLWRENDRMLKLSLPTPWSAGNLLGQVAYGVQELAATGDEMVAQKWLAVLSDDGRHALTVINDATYGCDFRRGELRLSVLRGPAHAAHPTGPDRSLVREDRPTPRLDRGEHVFRFWLDAGPRDERLTRVDRGALAHAERPFALAYWPPGGGTLPAAGPVLDDPAVQLTAFKKAEDGDELIVRLFEPTGKERRTTLALPHLELKHPVRLAPFEIRTLAIDPSSRRVREVSLVEDA